MGDTRNITYGSGRFFLASETVAIPTLSGSAADFANFSEPGYTQDGLELDHTVTEKELRVDEETDAVGILIDKETNAITVKFAEATMENLYFTIAGATMPDADTITFGGKERPNIFRAGVIGPGTLDPTTLLPKTREVILFRVYPKSAVKVHVKRTDMQIYQCQFIALADSTQPRGQRTGLYKQFAAPFVLV